MSCKRLTSIFLVFCIACKAPTAKREPHPAAMKTGGPKVRATVLTVDTVLQPSNRTLTHTILIAGDRARSDNEIDVWRLYDLKKNQVIFVDDISHTYRVEPFAPLLERRLASDDSVPDGLPVVTYSATSNRRNLLGAEAKQSVVTMGAYRRELWMATHPAIPPELFAMMLGSERRSSQLGELSRVAESALLKTRGFPLADHAELAYDRNARLVVDRVVRSIEQKDVPEAMLNVPAGYKQLAPLVGPERRVKATSRSSVRTQSGERAKPAPLVLPAIIPALATSGAAVQPSLAPGTATSSSNPAPGAGTGTTTASPNPPPVRPSAVQPPATKSQPAGVKKPSRAKSVPTRPATRRPAGTAPRKPSPAAKKAAVAKATAKKSTSKKALAKSPAAKLPHKTAAPSKRPVATKTGGKKTEPPKTPVKKTPPLSAPQRTSAQNPPP